MSIKTLVDNVIVEIGLSGEEGITVERFWQFVTEYRETQEVTDPIFANLLETEPGSASRKQVPGE
ncbi:hypothetical protein DSO57_1012043 [Entomophthora muscae]|uniref:Uncharacterized protein n=1 Tax=Entomophthora muscae TaxID=34485 RepID=A0ACC2RL13_9FUNG|nr:hypothetical protein DSO57_1012043 [Entomophthora muscae]